MKLAALIQKGGLREAATATVATSATDSPESAERVATLAKVAVAKPPDPALNPTAESELRRLVNLVADAYGFSPKDRAEALEVALRDHDRSRALICYRALVAECSGTVH